MKLPWYCTVHNKYLVKLFNLVSSPKLQLISYVKTVVESHALDRFVSKVSLSPTFNLLIVTDEILHCPHSFHSPGLTLSPRLP